MSKEKILLIAVKMPDDNEHHFNSSLDELAALSDTAGGVVKEIVTQNRHNIHPAFYLGEGKINEIKRLVNNLEIDLVISNDELSPGQLRNLGDRLEIPIIDRSQLILDIFAKRAHTKEGQMQVELAQLEYMLPRLHGKGIELSRLGGGIGTRGPGETKLETDQRHIRRRIQDIKRRLKIVVKQREQYRKRRRTTKAFQIAIVGYTNAGKSTLFNRLTESESLEEDQLFATLDPLTRKIRLPSGFQALITDTVGFLQELPTTLIAAFRSTLEEVTEADFILHIVDASNPDNEQQQNTVIELLNELGVEHVPTLTVYNKKDLLQKELIPMYYPYIFMNSFNKQDLRELAFKIESILKKEWNNYIIELNPSQGELLNRLENETVIDGKAFDEDANMYIIKGFMQTNHPLQYLLKE